MRNIITITDSILALLTPVTPPDGSNQNLTVALAAVQTIRKQAMYYAPEADEDYHRLDRGGGIGKEVDYVFGLIGLAASRVRCSVRPGGVLMEWTQIKNGASWLGFEGDKLLCIVEKVEDLPVEGWTPNVLQDCYTTPEAAKKAGEVILDQIARHMRTHDEPPPSPFAQFQPLLPVMKGIVMLLESKPAGIDVGRAPVPQPEVE
jgi:hypothetical protein